MCGRFGSADGGCCRWRHDQFLFGGNRFPNGAGNLGKYKGKSYQSIFQIRDVTLQGWVEFLYEMEEYFLNLLIYLSKVRSVQIQIKDSVINKLTSAD